MTSNLILTLCFITLFSQLNASELTPFKSDGCSLFPDGTAKQKDLWMNCCLTHDLAYWKGGSFQDKEIADENLKQCVSLVGEPTIAQIMLTGVRVGGSPYIPSPFRWGYGWSFGRGYKALNEDEKQRIKLILHSAKIAP